MLFDIIFQVKCFHFYLLLDSVTVYLSKGGGGGLQLFLTLLSFCRFRNISHGFLLLNFTKTANKRNDSLRQTHIF